MKQYLAESRLPEAALRPPIYRQDSDVANNDNNNTIQHSEYDDDQSWRAEFGAIYQEHIWAMFDWTMETREDPARDFAEKNLLILITP